MTAYDEVPYYSVALRDTHPERLAAIAALHGLRAPDPQTARILEIGCASGGNLIPMAARMPESTCVGVDLSRRQVEEGRGIIADLGLDNIELRHRDLQDLRDEEPYDYIIAHGVYSWVAPEVQARLLEVCRTSLSADGVAYVSYNALPGCSVYQSIRELAVFHVDGLDDPSRRCAEARGILQAFLEHLPSAQSRRALFRREVERILAAHDFFVLHDLLSEYNEPLYLHTFLERAEGLAYLDDAALVEGSFRPEVRARIDAVEGRIEQEQWEDFLLNRRFHETLLVHEGREVEAQRRPEALRGLALESSLRPEGELDDGSVRYRGPESTYFATQHPLMRSALDQLWTRPGGVPYAELLSTACAEAEVDEDAEADAILASGLLHCIGRLFLHPLHRPRQVAWPPRDQPETDPVVRRQARSGLPGVSTLRHAALAVSDVDRRLLLAADGTRDVEGLVEALLDDVHHDRLVLKGEGDPRARLDKTVPARVAKLSHEGCFR